MRQWDTFIWNDKVILLTYFPVFSNHFSSTSRVPFFAWGVSSCRALLRSCHYKACKNITATLWTTPSMSCLSLKNNKSPNTCIPSLQFSEIQGKVVGTTVSSTFKPEILNCHTVIDINVHTLYTHIYTKILSIFHDVAQTSMKTRKVERLWWMPTNDYWKVLLQQILQTCFAEHNWNCLEEYQWSITHKHYTPFVDLFWSTSWEEKVVSFRLQINFFKNIYSVKLHQLKYVTRFFEGNEFIFYLSMEALEHQH